MGKRLRDGYESIRDIEVDPHVRDIYLTTSELSGTFYRDIERVADSLELNNKVYLKRDGRSQYDRGIIKVLNNEGYHIGYIPKRDNKILKNLMDGGKILYGIINYLDFENKVIRIHVYLSYKDIEDEINDTLAMILAESEGEIC